MDVTPVKQLFRHEPHKGIYGDCHRAAIACVLDLRPEDVPHFGEHGDDDPVAWTREVNEFLALHGMTSLAIPFPGDDLKAVLHCVSTVNPGVYYLLTGKSRTGTNHNVVCLDGRIIHDPSLDDAGIIGPCNDGLYWVQFFGSLRAVVPA